MLGVAGRGRPVSGSFSPCRARRGSRPWDLVFSNAALHWVSAHDQVLRKLTVALTPGGQIAIQVPASHDHPSQLAAAEVAQEAPFRDALQGYVRLLFARFLARYREVLLPRLPDTRPHFFPYKRILFWAERASG